MNYPSREFDEALAALCHGTASEEQAPKFFRVLQTNPRARDAYLLAVELHARLITDNSLFVRPLPMNFDSVQEQVGQTDAMMQIEPGPRRSLNRRWYLVLGTTAALLLVGLVAWFFLGREMASWEKTSVLVRVLETDKATPGTWIPGESLFLDYVNLTAGTLRLGIESSGVILDISGPAEMRLASSMLVQLARGQVTVDVGERGKGFSVETAQGKFRDLGTTFGVQAGNEGTTDLVVFKGNVQVYADARRAAPLSTLAEGEAVRVGGDRSLTRIPNIVSGPVPGLWSTQPPEPESCVIASVRDNLRSPNDRVFYQIIPGGFQENTLAYVGPGHMWKGRTSKGLPPYLLGADMVRTFPHDQGKKDLNITVRLSRPVMLYVLFETRHQQGAWRRTPNTPEAPVWLEKNFHKIGDAVGLDDAGQLKPGEKMSLKPGEGHLVTFDVWERKITEPGEVTLGPPTGPEGWKNWMYGILAKPLDKP